MDGAIIEVVVDFVPGLACLLFAVPCNIDTSKLFERKLFNLLRFCSVVLLDQLDLTSSRENEDGPSSPHLFISVAEDVNELKIDIKSVLEQTIPAADVADAGVVVVVGGLGTSEARLLIDEFEIDDTVGIGNSENRRF